MRVIFESNKTDDLITLKKKQNQPIAIVVTILIVIKIVYKPLYIAKQDYNMWLYRDFKIYMNNCVRI